MQLGITTIQKNRAPWIKEWIAFHYLVGFRKFYFFAHNCSDDTQGVLAKLKKTFDIKIITLDSDLDRPQLTAYQYACDHFLQEVNWMAFIDSDEFLFPTHDDSLETALRGFSSKKISALGVYWVCFGSSSFKEEPPGLIIENYRYRPGNSFVNNKHIKSILLSRPAAQIQVGDNAHLFKTPLGTYDENLRPITFGQTDYEPTYEKFRINHYVCQSRSYFLNFKKASGSADGDMHNVRPESWWEEHDRNEVLDNSMERFIKPLKKILEKL